MALTVLTRPVSGRIGERKPKAVRVWAICSARLLGWVALVVPLVRLFELTAKLFPTVVPVRQPPGDFVGQQPDTGVVLRRLHNASVPVVGAVHGLDVYRLAFGRRRLVHRHPV